MGTNGNGNNNNNNNNRTLRGQCYCTETWSSVSSPTFFALMTVFAVRNGVLNAEHQYSTFDVQNAVLNRTLRGRTLNTDFGEFLNQTQSSRSAFSKSCKFSSKLNLLCTRCKVVGDDIHDSMKRGANACLPRWRQKAARSVEGINDQIRDRGNQKRADAALPLARRIRSC